MPPMTLSHAGTRMTVTLSNFLMQLPAAVCGWGLLPCPPPLWWLDTQQYCHVAGMDVISPSSGLAKALAVTGP